MVQHPHSLKIIIMTEFFGIEHFSGGKDSGKVLIMIYYFNYYYYYYVRIPIGGCGTLGVTI